MNGVSDQERQSVMSSAESQSSQWTRGRRLMVSLPIFIILLGILFVTFIPGDVLINAP